MSFEQRLRTGLADRLAQVDAPWGDLGAVRRDGARLRRRRRRDAVAAATASVAVFATVGAVALPQYEDRGGEPAGSQGSWSRIADMPLSPRASALVGWTGREVLVVGGGTKVRCEEDATRWYCVPRAASDQGAAYDPETETWRRITDAPERFLWADFAMVGDTLVVEGEDHDLYAYDPDLDRWRSLPRAPLPTSGIHSVLAGRLYTTDASGDIALLDVTTGRWSTQGSSEIRPAMESFSVLATDEGLLQVGRTYNGASVVDRWDGHAWQRLETDGLELNGMWTGDFLLGVASESEDQHVLGARFDPTTEEWSLLPPRPDLDPTVMSETWQFTAQQGQFVADLGLVYDDQQGTWTWLNRPASDVDRDMSGVWAEDRLFVVGGRDADEEAIGRASDLSNEAWVWTP